MDNGRGGKSPRRDPLHIKVVVGIQIESLPRRRLKLKPVIISRKRVFGRGSIV